MGMLKFASDESVDKKKSSASARKWKVMIVDDEVEVHTITQAVLSSFNFDGDGVEVVSAYSGAEALSMLSEHNDTALVLLDVVMETDDAGLMVAKKIREELDNTMVRIVLRTGQPGSAPEREVIRNYDINDYKEKTELTSQKLYTTIMAALRSYRDLKIIHENRVGLNMILEATQDLLTLRSMKLLSEGVLTQIIAMLKVDPGEVMLNAGGAFTVQCPAEENDYELVASTGVFSKRELAEFITEDMQGMLEDALKARSNILKDDAFVGYVETSKGMKNLIYLSDYTHIDENGRQLLDIFMVNTSVMYENLVLNNEIIDTQKELVGRLGDVVEKRSQDTANHVNRVAQISYILAKAYGINEEEAQIMCMASPMHDIGKVSTPDSILLKPGQLTDDEFEVMKSHSRVGYDILNPSDRGILKTAAIIAHEHHEKWDGTGYPQGLKGEDIHIYGRITAIADVFDALSHKRVYKDAWAIEKILDLIEGERGKHFDPALVTLFFEHKQEILTVTKLYG
ncbi:MAG: DUF3369 domain-containing protein [Fibrobacterales bacterium]